MTRQIPRLRIVLASTFIAASALLAGCGSPSSSTSTQTATASPPPMAEPAPAATNYRK
jgi:hypothetical protein